MDNRGVTNISLIVRSRSLETLKVSDGEHRAIIDAIETGHDEFAGRAMHAHLSPRMGNITNIHGTMPKTLIPYLAQF